MEISLIWDNKKVFDKEIAYTDIYRWLGLVAVLLIVASGDVNSLKLIDKMIRL